MKKLFLALVLLAATLTFSTPAIAQEGWTKATSSEGGTEIWLRDEDWVKGRSHMRSVKVWARMVNLDEGRHTVMDHAMILYLFDCVAETSRILTATAYLNGKAGASFHDSSPDHVIPDTKMASVLALVCSDPTPTAPTYDIPDFNAPQVPSWET